MKTKHLFETRSATIASMRSLKTTVIGIGMLTLAALLPCVLQSDAAPHSENKKHESPKHSSSPILPPQAKVGGKNLSQWVEAFSKWTLPIPTSLSFFDDGHSFALNQRGPVWFLQPGCNNRSIKLPKGKYLFAPLTFAWNESPCPDSSFQPAPGQSMEDFLTAGLAPFFDGRPPADGALIVDGTPLINLGAYRATSKLFYSVIDPSYSTTLGDPCAGYPTPGTLQPCVMDGYWVMIKPLRVGHHILEYPGCDVIHVDVVNDQDDDDDDDDEHGKD